MTERFDAIVVGAGHNGLVAAAMLADAGRRVLVLERASQVGGAAVTREFAEGFAVSAGAQWLYQLQPAVVKSLGIKVPLAAASVDTAVLDSNGEHVRYGTRNVEGVGDDDGSRYPDYTRRMRRFSRLLWRWLNRIPPALNVSTDGRSLLRMAVELRLLGRRDMREFLRLIASNIYDDVEATFDHPLLRAGLCLDAVLGTHAGPRSPNTIMTSLYRLGGDAGPCALPAGGMGSVSSALAKTARDSGADIRTSTAVARMTVVNGRVTGVETQEGEAFRSNVVVSNVDPRQTLLSLVGARHLETGVVRRVEAIRCSGNVAKLHLALDGLPDTDEALLRHRLLIAATPDAVELAFNPAKYGEFSREPVMDVSIPSLHDETLAPSGQHVLSAIVQYAPYALRGGWTDEAKQTFLDACLETLDRHLPGARARVVEGELLTPVDLEREFGMTGGHWHHGELALDQFLFTRPFVGAQQYRAPIDGLFFCSAGSHPGGGVTGAAGRNAALSILNRDKRR